MYGKTAKADCTCTCILKMSMELTLNFEWLRTTLKPTAKWSDVWMNSFEMEGHLRFSWKYPSTLITWKHWRGLCKKREPRHAKSGLYYPCHCLTTNRLRWHQHNQAFFWYYTDYRIVLCFVFSDYMLKLVFYQKKACWTGASPAFIW